MIVCKITINHKFKTVNFTVFFFKKKLTFFWWFEYLDVLLYPKTKKHESTRSRQIDFRNLIHP